MTFLSSRLLSISQSARSPYLGGMPTIIETWPAEAEAVQRHSGPLFMDAELAPNRSLRNPAFWVLMGAVMLISFTAGIAFISIGAWPVTGFFGLDLVLIWLAFRISYRDGRAREWVRVDARDIEVTRRHPGGHLQRFRLPTPWVKFRLLNPGKHDAQIALSSHGRALVVGRFLSPGERDAFAAALKRAIATATVRSPQEPGGDLSGQA